MLPTSARRPRRISQPARVARRHVPAPALDALRSGNAEEIRKVLAPIVELTFECSVCAEGEDLDESKKPKRMHADDAARALANNDHDHLVIGPIVSCSDDTCVFEEGPWISHSSRVVHTVTFDPKSGRIARVRGTDG